MAKSIEPVIRITDLDQVCFVVRNVDRSMESMWNDFGIGPWNVRVHDTSSMSDVTYHGKPTHYVFKAARTQKKGGFEIELVEPLSGDSIYHDFLREHGEGVQHLGYYNPNSFEAFTETYQTLEKAGFPCVMGGRSQVGAFSYFDLSKVLNTIIEVVWWDPSIVPLPPPTYVFPK